ncbi:hypothetical protein DFJ74DRAFT_710606 [Hyaloraphidium curvatum]|nr:hypothetical protein DFJ74DRAFT_710606 [Hyaloraphidium curvatum]
MSTVKDSGAPVVAVVGTGFGGLAASTSNGIGGTWRHQRYPGAACDVPAHYYSLSFELNPSWSSEYPPRVEMKAYMERVFEKYGLRPYTRFNTEIKSIRWNADEGVWDMEVTEYAPPESREDLAHVEGEGNWRREWNREPVREYVFKANLVFNSCGPFTKPYIPDYEGVDSFKGRYVHSVEWDESIDFSGKSVGIVGSGPTAIQVVSQLAEKVGKLDIYQRTKNWIFPYRNVPFTEEQKEIWRSDPAALVAKRQSLVDAGAQTWFAIENPDSPGAEALKQMIIENYHKIVKKPGVIPLITPDYPIGCKRILVDCNYLEQLNRDHVNLVVDPIARFTPNGIVAKNRETGQETERSYDIIIWCTGWGSIAFGRAYPIYAASGEELWDYWKRVGNPRSYLGTMCHGYPNPILGPGPQGNAFTSYIEVLEQRVDFMLRVLDELQRRNAQSLEPKVEAEEMWDRVHNEASRGTPFAGNCFTWDAWNEAGADGGGHIGKQAEGYAPGTFLNPIFYPGLYGEMREDLETADMDTLEYTKKEGTWKFPPRPKKDLSHHRLRHVKLRDPKDSPIGKLRRSSLPPPGQTAWLPKGERKVTRQPLMGKF